MIGWVCLNNNGNTYDFCIYHEFYLSVPSSNIPHTMHIIPIQNIYSHLQKNLNVDDVLLTFNFNNNKGINLR